MENCSLEEFNRISSSKKTCSTICKLNDEIKLSLIESNQTKFETQDNFPSHQALTACQMVELFEQANTIAVQIQLNEAKSSALNHPELDINCLSEIQLSEDRLKAVTSTPAEKAPPGIIEHFRGMDFIGSPTHPQSASTISSSSNPAHPSFRQIGSKDEVNCIVKPTSLFRKNEAIQDNNKCIKSKDIKIVNKAPSSKFLSGSQRLSSSKPLSESGKISKNCNLPLTRSRNIPSEQQHSQKLSLGNMNLINAMSKRSLSKSTRITTHEDFSKNQEDIVNPKIIEKKTSLTGYESGNSLISMKTNAKFVKPVIHGTNQVIKKTEASKESNIPEIINSNTKRNIKKNNDNEKKNHPALGLSIKSELQLTSKVPPKKILCVTRTQKCSKH